MISSVGLVIIWIAVAIVASAEHHRHGYGHWYQGRPEAGRQCA